ncbi:MAG: OsmC family protein [Solirubrobacterales bacterium]
MAATVVTVAETHEGRYVQAAVAGGHTLRVDEPQAAGGNDAGPTPYDLLLAALGSCTSMTLRMYAERKGWNLRHVEVRLRQGRIHAEDCAECETKTGTVHLIVRDIVLEGDLDEERRRRLLEIAERCPVHRTLTGEIRIVTGLVGKVMPPDGGEE